MRILRYGIRLATGTLKASKLVTGRSHFSVAQRNHGLIQDFFKGSQTGPMSTIHVELKDMYKNSLEPLEKQYLFHEFHSQKLTDADFDSKPSVMFIGQYSTGKTTFLEHIVGKQYPGMRIGPEPTTDKFVVIMNGEEESIIPGNALVVDPSLPYGPLARFGNRFLNRLQVVKTKSPVLEDLTLIDTPGILSGEKQLIDRGYNFGEIIHWFAERVDRVVMLFDAHKLDISDEFKSSIQMLKSYEEKVRVVLNKSDQVTPQQLMRVYGALMWSLGKILNSPEVARVYIGSFWSKPLQYIDNKHLFELEHDDLYKDLQTLPRQNSLRKLNDFIRRTRSVKVHAYIISELKASMPYMFRKEEIKQRLIQDLRKTFIKIQTKYHVSPGDFPDLITMQRQLQQYDFSSFNSLNVDLITKVDEVLEQQIPKLMSELPIDNLKLFEDVQGGVFDLMKNNPFQSDASLGVNEGMYDHSGKWIVGEKMPEYEESFYKISKRESDKISGSQAREHLIQSKLPNTDLALIWKLADVDNDGLLDLEQWALANHLIKIRVAGGDLPSKLPAHLQPPGKIKATVNTRINDPNTR